MTDHFSLGQLEYFVAVPNTASVSAASVRRPASQARISTGSPAWRAGSERNCRCGGGPRSVLLTIGDPLEEAGVVTAHAASVSPIRRARAFARYARDTPATTKATA
ncbi:hypothetical protein [Streptomyces europaeiscabiei]|uniref:hypothetical protein n=1 Tax=Streptomyces europaeiscabiei TaxID=146819 RepID=UPI002E1963E0|nr:hypothetical protein OG858_03395 [Streptomyces europaeiscabiei]